MTEEIVTIAQMQAIENHIFTSGMPIAALMEKVGILISQRFQQLFPLPNCPRVGVIFGAGHNGGDALVVARELHCRGYQVLLFSTSNQLKDLTASHYQYATSLGILTVADVAELKSCQVILDGFFGFGLDRQLSATLITTIAAINHLQLPIISIDLPSGIHADSGKALGAAINATHTFCLGLWKQAFVQDQALYYLGQAELINFDIPATAIQAILGTPSPIQMMTKEVASQYLPQQRPLVTHKYQQGHLLLVVGSWQYAGAAILAGLGARASGVGLLSIAVPNSIKLAVLQSLPDAIVIGCPETEQGAIAHLPVDINWSKYTAIATGCGLTTEPVSVIITLLEQNLPLVLDADALNILAQMPTSNWSQRSAPTIITPHDGEWRRLFPTVDIANRLAVVMQKAAEHQLIILSKGARTIISDGTKTWAINNGTPALARGGSGDVLTGLIGGLVAAAQKSTKLDQLVDIVASANWWHAAAGSLAAQERGTAGVDAVTLSQFLHSNSKKTANNNNITSHFGIDF
jgi:ADP-dependent NAD(P)H-hydrate dehydratase / NAD(P)H-hydrate epimerase